MCCACDKCRHSVVTIAIFFRPDCAAPAAWINGRITNPEAPALRKDRRVSMAPTMCSKQAVHARRKQWQSAGAQADSRNARKERGQLVRRFDEDFRRSTRGQAVRAPILNPPWDERALPDKSFDGRGWFSYRARKSQWRELAKK